MSVLELIGFLAVLAGVAWLLWYSPLSHGDKHLDDPETGPAGLTGATDPADRPAHPEDVTPTSV